MIKTHLLHTLKEKIQQVFVKLKENVYDKLLHRLSNLSASSTFSGSAQHLANYSHTQSKRA